MTPTTHVVSVGDLDLCAGQPSPCVGFFSPLVLSISVGDSVRWINESNTIAHTTTSGLGGTSPGTADGIWDSGTLGLGDSFTRSFDSAGTFTLFCEIHPIAMGTATITVEG